MFDRIFTVAMAVYSLKRNDVSPVYEGWIADVYGGQAFVSGS